MAAGWRNALAGIGVLAALIALIAVPAVIQAILPEQGPPPSGERLEVGYGVTLRPPAGAALDLADSRPGGGEVVLLTHGLRLEVTAVQVRERPADYVRHARRKLSRDKGFDVGTPEQVRTVSGVPGQRSDLRMTGDGGTREPGCATIFTGEEAGAVAVITRVRSCADVPVEVWDAVRSLTFEPVRPW